MCILKQYGHNRLHFKVVFQRFSNDSNHQCAFAVVLLQAATQPKDVRQSHKLHLNKVYNNDNQSKSLHAVKALVTSIQFWVNS